MNGNKYSHEVKPTPRQENKIQKHGVQMRAPDVAPPKSQPTSNLTSFKQAHVLLTHKPKDATPTATSKRHSQLKPVKEEPTVHSTKESCPDAKGEVKPVSSMAPSDPFCCYWKPAIFE